VHNNRRIKVLQIIETLGVGGAERLLATNMKFIDKERFENIIVSIYSDKDSEIIHEALIGTKIEKICPRFRHDVFAIAMGILKCVKKHKIDIIHTHAPLSNIYGWIIGRLTGCGVISSIHNADYEVVPFAGNLKYLSVKIKVFLMRIIDRCMGGLCVDKFIAVSEFVKQYAIRESKYSPGKIYVLYNGIDADYFNEVDNAAVSAKRKELGIESDEKIILTVGTNVPRKGQRYALEAAKNLTAKHKIKLVIRGSGPMRNELEAYSNKLCLKDHVIFLNPQKDIRVLLQMCDVFVFASLCEGFGIAQTEAMAMKKPVVAFNIGPMPEVVKDGVSGILAEPRDSEKLARSIEIILNNPELAERMGLAGRRLVEEKFDIRKNIKLLENVYSGVFNNRKGNLA
jgi:glycosyltransferase involved in cell wall biosynthesis